MSLLDDVSIVVTPNGYKAGTLYGVLPTAIEGADIIFNGDFATNVNGWTDDSGATLTWQSDSTCLVTTTGDNTFAIKPSTPVLLSNKQYKISFRFKPNSTGTFRVRNASNVMYSSTSFIVGDWNNVEFIATSTSVYLEFGTTGGSITNFYIDDIVVKEWTASDMDVTRATSATRVNEQGLIEEVPYNLLQQSNTFNTTWTLSSSIDLTSGQSGVGGSTDAWLLKRNSTGSRYIAQALSLSSDQYSFSVYLKAESTNWAYIWSYDGTTQNNAYFDLQNGVVGNTSGANFDGTKIESVGDGWYRCTLIYTQATTIVRIYPAYSNGSISIGTDNGIYIQYSQLEVGSTSKTYLPTTTRLNVPRIDYTGGGCPHILAEPQRTNLVTYSEDFSNWSNFRSTLTPNETTSPDGTINAYLVEQDYPNTSVHGGLNKSIAVTNGVEYTYSFFVKKKEYSFIELAEAATSSGNVSTWFDVENGVVGNIGAGSTAQIENYGNGWYRCSITFTSAFTGGRNFVLYLTTANGSSVANIVGGAYIWGAQLEEGYPTSYIPTSGSAVTRNQDQFTRDGIGSLINSTEGVLFAEMAALDNDLTTRMISLSDGGNTNRIHMFYHSVSNEIAVNYRVSGTTEASIGFVVSNITNFNKIAFKWKSADFALWINGVEVGTDSNTTMLPADTLNELAFEQGNGGNNLYAKVKQLQVYKTALTDMQLIQLTGTAGTDFYESYSEMAESLTYTIQ